MKICKIYTAFTNFDRFEFAVNGGFGLKAPLERACCRDSKNPNPPIHTAIPTIKTRSSYRGFFVSAVCKYGRDNQPNDASGFATRTCAGGNGGLNHRASAGASSLFGRAFKHNCLMMCKSVIADATDGSARTYAERSSDPSGIGFAFRSRFTIRTLTSTL